MDRRKLLKAGAAAAALNQVPVRGFARPSPPPLPDPPPDENDKLFKTGVASGNPTSTSFVAWTRADFAAGTGSQPLLLEVAAANDPGFAAARKIQTVAISGRDHTASVTVAGLAPETYYFYRFSSGEVRSRVGRAKTLPRPDAIPSAPYRVGFITCSDIMLNQADFGNYKVVSDEAFDFVVFLGDYIYADTSPSLVSLREYWGRYFQTRRSADLKALHASTPCFAIWDDHEVENDYSGVVSQHGDSARDSGFLARRARAYQAFFDYMPFDRAAGAEANRIYGSVDIGRVARLYLLDGRQYRAAPPCIGVYGGPADGIAPGYEPAANRYVADAACSDLDGERTYLGADQETWLSAQLKSSVARWNIFCNNTMICPFDERDADGRTPTHNTDSWSGYPRARGRLIADLLKYKVKNPVFVTGDLHAFCIGNLHQVPEDVTTPLVALEFVTTAIAHETMKGFDAFQYGNAPLAYLNGDRMGYTAVEISPQGLAVHLKGIGGGGADVPPFVFNDAIRPIPRILPGSP